MQISNYASWVRSDTGGRKMDGLPPPGWMDPPGGFGQDASNALDRAQAEPRIYPGCLIRELEYEASTRSDYPDTDI